MLSDNDLAVGLGVVAVLATGPLYFWWASSVRRAKAVIRQGRELVRR